MEQKSWYIYLLCDPDTEVPFYVGKGTGNRIDHHEHYQFDRNPDKVRIIRDIKAQGKSILKKIIAEFTDERDAYIYEWAMINLYSEHITNIKPGGGKLHPIKEAREKLARMPVEKPIKAHYIYTDLDPYQSQTQVMNDQSCEREAVESQ